jgi:hypothetical protein
MVVRVLHRSRVTVKDLVVLMLLRAARLKIAEDIAHDGVDVAAADLAIHRNPAVELAAADDDLAADRIARERMARVFEIIAELSDRQSAVSREGLERQKRIELRADDHALGQDAADLGDAAASCGPESSQLASNPILRALAVVLSAHEEPRLKSGLQPDAGGQGE